MTDTPETPSAFLRHAALAVLTLCTLWVHGYHPLAEDGGVYITGIQSILNPSLFPHDLAFATATRHYSLFAPLMAQIVQSSHIPLPWLLLLVDLAGTWLLLYAAWRIAAQCFRSQGAILFAVALLAAWFTLPIAGTSLWMMDPYVTARTLATPLSLLAISFAMSIEWTRTPRNTALLRCILCLAIAASLHLLMAAYATALVLTILIAKLPSSRARIIGYACIAAAALLIAATLQISAPPESAAVVAATSSRYYWFLSRWQWFEDFGLAAPLIILALLLRFAQRQIGPRGIALCRACIAIGLIAMCIALLFAHEQYATHLVARLQPLRTFLLIYTLFIVLLGGTLAEFCITRWKGLSSVFLPSLIVALACTMLFVQLETFPASDHLELPWRQPLNPWSQAFIWSRDHTPSDALFALDADYTKLPAEDSQTFRATAQRSVLPDFSKDGGEASVRPSLAEAWFAGQTVQKDLSTLTGQQRSARLQPLGVTWVVLPSGAKTNGVCPYANAAVKVCQLP